MSKFIIAVSDLIGLVINYYTMIGFVCGLLIYRNFALRKKLHLKRMLSLGGLPKTCFVSIPKFSGILAGYHHHRDLAIFEDVSLLLDISLFLMDAGIKVETSIDESDITCNEIQIGGPAANEFTNRYVNYYLKDFKFLNTSRHIQAYKDDANLQKMNFSFLEVSEDEKIGFKVKGDFYPYIHGKKDVAVLVKIIDKSDYPHRTIHLLFGGGDSGTIGAVNYFRNHYSSIYKANKSRPYIGIFEVDYKGSKVGKIRWYDIREDIIDATTTVLPTP